jgi:hypothetical protein
MRAYLYSVSRASSRLINAIIGGYSGETLSGRAWRTKNVTMIKVFDSVWYLLGDGEEHCLRSYIMDVLGGDHPSYGNQEFKNGR